MITANIKVLIAQKEQAERRRLSYRIISEETGIASSSLFGLASNKSKMIGLSTLDRLCSYFGVGPSEILLWSPNDEGAE